MNENLIRISIFRYYGDIIKHVLLTDSKAVFQKNIYERCCVHYRFPGQRSVGNLLFLDE
jgi:hypothetical protein